MKEFLKFTLASVVGCAIVAFFSLFMFFAMMIASAMSSFTQTDAKPVDDCNVLRITLNGMLNNKTEENPFAVLLGNSDEGNIAGMDVLTQAIKAAKENKQIKGIYLDCSALGAQFAEIEELRALLNDFKEADKFVLAYADAYTQGTYYAASLADKVYLNPSGVLSWHGISANPLFFKGLMDKVGVKMQIFRVGTFKSAVEPYMLEKMSPANREMTESMIGSMWETVCEGVSKDRNISIDSLKAYANDYYELKDATTYVKDGFIDSLLYIDQMRDELRRYLGEQDVTFASVSDMAFSYKPKKSKDKVAVYVAEGEIVDAEPSNGLNHSSNIVGNRLVADLDLLAHDKDVKAVVLRVNSPGGSAFASEQMWRAVQLLKKEKPVIVSMGGMAASGGYYLSCGADYIFADPTTLTGSIGIFGMVPDFSHVAEDFLGLHFDHVSTNTNPDLASPTGHVSKLGGAAMQKHVEKGYALFLKRVAEGRGMEVDNVDRIAQGRVWTGRQAIKINLVDSLGTLESAIAYAAKKAELSDYQIDYRKDDTNFFTKLLEKGGDNYFERKLKKSLGEWAKPIEYMRDIESKNQLQARLPYFINIK